MCTTNKSKFTYENWYVHYDWNRLYAEFISLKVKTPKKKKTLWSQTYFLKYQKFPEYEITKDEYDFLVNILF